MQSAMKARMNRQALRQNNLPEDQFLDTLTLSLLKTNIFLYRSTGYEKKEADIVEPSF